ncbi:MAG: transposase [Verrucomicrobiia bacterium]
MGSCLLSQPAHSKIVANALLYFESKRYTLGEWVIMPNHVHAIVTPNPGFDLSNILHSWKSFTATRINQLTGKTGSLWQKESYNQILRDESHQWKFEEYIRNNPTKAGITVHHASFLEK